MSIIWYIHTIDILKWKKCNKLLHFLCDKLFLATSTNSEKALDHFIAISDNIFYSYFIPASLSPFINLE